MPKPTLRECQTVHHKHTVLTKDYNEGGETVFQGYKSKEKNKPKALLPTRIRRTALLYGTKTDKNKKKTLRKEYRY